MAENSSKINR